MGGVTVQQMADRVAELMELRLKVRGRGLAAKLRRGGRALPRRVRAEALYLAEAAEKAQVPKLLLQLDHQRIATAYDACVRHLAPLGRAGRLRGYLLNLAANLGLILLATLALIVTVLVLRGYL